jgi:hypothetical protein
MHTKLCSENLKGRKRPLGRPRRRWEDNIRMDVRKIVWKFVDWIFVTQDMEHWRALVNTNELQGSIKVL